MPQSPDHDGDSNVDRARSFDPERGTFDPSGHPPLEDPLTNPRGVRHINETAQDHMIATDRPRYRAAQRRRSRMIAAASAAKRRLGSISARRSTASRGGPPEPRA